MAIELCREEKLANMHRSDVLNLLGAPQRSDTVFPQSQHHKTVDSYSLSRRNEQHLRIEYDSHDQVVTSYMEPTPLAVPRVLGLTQSVTTLPEAKLHKFLTSTSEEALRKLHAKELEGQLGVPARRWREASDTGGQRREWLTYLYFLSPDSCSAFVVMFDAASNQLYECRIETIDRNAVRVISDH
jgi:hypothetical protein